MRILLASALLLVVSPAALSQAQWKFGFSSNTFSNLGQACEFLRTANGWTSETHGIQYDSGFSAGSTCGTYTGVSCGIYYIPNGNVPPQATASCVVPSCDWTGLQESDSENPSIRWGTGSSPLASDVFCHPVYNCRGTMTGNILNVGNSWIGEVTYTNGACTTSTPPPGDDGNTCVAGSFGMACKTDDGMNVNGDTVSDSADPETCQAFASGGTMCVVPAGDTASTPPAPDSGTPGDPAEPTASVTNLTTNNTTNYYSSTVVTNSSTPTNASPAPGGVGGAPGNGSTQGQGGDGDGIDDDGCTEEDGCTGAVPELDEGVCTFGECAQEFFDRVQDAPLLAAVTNLGDNIPASGCPVWNVPVFEDEISISTPICGIWESVAPTLSVIFLLVWAWVAARIVLSA